MIQLNITSTYTKLLSTDVTLLKELDDLCSYEVSGAFFSPKVQRGHWDGRKHLFSTRTGLFPTGLTTRVQDYLTSKGLVPQVNDYRVQPTSVQPLPSQLTPYDWQKGVMGTCYTKRNGIVKVGTGGGKSRMMVTIIGTLNLKTVLLVNKLDILYQFKRWFKNDLGLAVGQIGDGVVDPQRITIVMIQTASNAFKLKADTFDEKDKTKLDAQRLQIVFDLFQQAECVIGDEVHGLVARTFYGLQKYFKNTYYKLGWSATPFRTDEANLLLEAAFGPRIVDISSSMLIKMGYLTKPTFYFVQTHHPKLPKDLSYAQVYSQEVTENEKRNLLITKLATKFWQKGRRILIIVQHIRHGFIIEEMLKNVVGASNVRFVRGESDTDLRTSTIQELNAGTLRLVIATKIFSEGVDIQNLEVLINAKAQVSEVDYVQVIGRALRKAPNKSMATIVDIYDYGCRYLTRHSKERYEVATEEPEYVVHSIDETKV